MNGLANLDEFQTALRAYEPSPAALKIVRKARLVLMVGPTGAGRNTLIDRLVETGDYYFIVGDTTREMRHKDNQPIEKNGREYWFRSEAEVLAELQKGEYIEAALIHNQQVSGWSMHEVEKANKQGKIAIKEIQQDGARTVHGFKPDTHIIFNLPPSFAEWQRRLQSRGHMDPAEFKRRMESAVVEYETALASDYYMLIINDTIENAVAQVTAIVDGNVDPAFQKQARTLTVELLSSTRSLLSTLA